MNTIEAQTTIKQEIRKIQNLAKVQLGLDLDEEHAFIYVVIDNFFNQDDDKIHLADIRDQVTDGKNDGGIDFVCYNDDKPAVVIGQSKYVTSIQPNDIIGELNKIINTFTAFKSGHASSFNQNVQRELQEAFDRLPDESTGSVEYLFVTSAEVNYDQIAKKITTKLPDFDLETFTLIDRNDIAEAIMSKLEENDIVKEDYIEIDSSRNFLEYEAANGRRGVFVNVKSTSIQRLYRKYIDRGLLSLNIRGFVRNKNIDDGIRRTLNKEREDFWFYNNGLTIACSHYWRDGDRIKMTDFSIVNGGQTTTLIGKYDGSNTDEFLIPCKIIAHSGDEDPQIFFSNIAEATNSQKPIKPRDLKSNAREMQRLQSWFREHDIFLEIKRGDKRKKGNRYLLNNETWAQLMLSFVYQQPGTARSGKRAIWENADTYDKLFKQNYVGNTDKQEFVLDLVDLWKRFLEIDKKFKGPDTPLVSIEQKEVFKNGRMAIFGLLGALYDIVNEDLQSRDIQTNTGILDTHGFVYGAFLRNYRQDDLDFRLEAIVRDLVGIMADAYDICIGKGVCSSVSNLLKSDKKYRAEVLIYLIKAFNWQSGKEILSNASAILSRKH